jgi:hypothetical protein
MNAMRVLTLIFGLLGGAMTVYIYATNLVESKTGSTTTSGKIPRLHVVFGANVFPSATKNFEKAFELLCIYVTRIAMLPAHSVHLELSVGNSSHESRIISKFFSLLPSHRGSVNVTRENLYEFPGIYRAWLLGRKHPDDIIAYIHNKGATKKSWLFALHYYNGTFRPVKSVMKMFQACPYVMTAGGTCADKNIFEGVYAGLFVYHNFWYARGSYLAQLEEPVPFRINAKRFYYEYWLGRGKCEDVATEHCLKRFWRKNLRSCFSLLFQRNGVLSLPASKLWSNFAMCILFCVFLLASFLGSDFRDKFFQGQEFEVSAKKSVCSSSLHLHNVSRMPNFFDLG